MTQSNEGQVRWLKQWKEADLEALGWETVTVLLNSAELTVQVCRQECDQYEQSTYKLESDLQLLRQEREELERKLKAFESLYAASIENRVEMQRQLTETQEALNGTLLCEVCGMDLGAACHWSDVTGVGNHRFASALLLSPNQVGERE